MLFPYLSSSVLYMEVYTEMHPTKSITRMNTFTTFYYKVTKTKYSHKNMY